MGSSREPEGSTGRTKSDRIVNETDRSGGQIDGEGSRMRYGHQLDAGFDRSLVDDNPW
jgi:hypothetical protein